MRWCLAKEWFIKDALSFKNLSSFFHPSTHIQRQRNVNNVIFFFVKLARMQSLLHLVLFWHFYVGNKTFRDALLVSTTQICKSCLVSRPPDPRIGFIPSRFQTFMGAFIPNIYAFDPFVLCQTIQQFNPPSAFTSRTDPTHPIPSCLRI